MISVDETGENGSRACRMTSHINSIRDIVWICILTLEQIDDKINI